MVKSPRGRTSPDFSLKDVPGTSGRLDVVCRCIIAALLTPEGVRRGVRFTAVLVGPPNPPLSITVDGGLVDAISLDEVEVATSLAEAMRGNAPLGYSVAAKGLEEVVDEISRSGYTIYELCPRGLDIFSASFGFGESVAFVLGADIGLSREDKDLLRRAGAQPLSIGNQAYLASHCISFVNYLLDLRSR